MQVLYVRYNRPRNRPRALQGERQCYRGHRSKERDECATREPERAWITGGRGDSRSDEREDCVFYLILKITVKERDFVRMSEDVEERSGV